MCESKFRVGMIGSSFFIVWCLSLLWIPRLADVYGRKNLFRIAQVIDFLLFTGMLLTNSLNVAIAIIFSIGFTTSIRLAAGYIYMLEFIPQRRQTTFACAWCVFEASIMLWITLYFLNSTTRNWYTVPMIGYVMQIFAVAGVFFIPESPKFLLE